MLQIAAHAESEDGSQEDKSSIGETDLLIVGPGVLGRLIAQEWKKVTCISFYLYKKYFSKEYVEYRATQEQGLLAKQEHKRTMLSCNLLELFQF